MKVLVQQPKNVQELTKKKCTSTQKLHKKVDQIYILFTTKNWNLSVDDRRKQNVFLILSFPLGHNLLVMYK